ncbi:MAG TPA: hypothetical protein VIA29_11425 [Thermoanaerobaculia bacterium]
MTHDRKLTRLFEEARREDEARAPELSELMARPRRLEPETAPSAARRLAPILATLALLALALAIFRSEDPVSPPPPATPAAEAFLSQPRWHAPTDFLLEPPSGELWSSTPSIGTTVPEIDAGSPEPKKGTRT